MLVDDDPSARFIMRTILGDFPDEFEIVAETGRAPEAAGLLSESRPEVVLLDARMPLLSGYELAGRLREVDGAVRLVLLTSFVDDEVRSRARQAGIDACMDKGEFDEIPRVVREVVSQEPGATAAPG
jgi:DNA-binding NarL/FixJ family response regulator